MAQIRCVLALVFLMIVPRVLGEDAASPAAELADFKLTIELSGVEKVALGRSELVVHKGLAYQFFSDVPDEITMIEPRTSNVRLLDLKRRLQTEIKGQRLDLGLAEMRRASINRIEAEVKAGGKANRVSAAMGRDLIDVQLQATYVDKLHQLRLSNATIELEATGEPEPDLLRLAVIHSSLTTVLKLDAYREPDGLPPFAKLQALDTLAAGHRLRPVDLTVLYRLAGPPKKLRWTYQLVPKLTAREVEAIARINTMRLASRFVKFEDYETMEEK